MGKYLFTIEPLLPDLSKEIIKKEVEAETLQVALQKLLT
jgi:hypothetical protein